jgi:hypothetical protein
LFLNRFICTENNGYLEETVVSKIIFFLKNLKFKKIDAEAKSKLPRRNNIKKEVDLDPARDHTCISCCCIDK